MTKNDISTMAETQIMASDLGVLLGIHVCPEAEILQVNGLVFRLIWEAHHLLGRRHLQKHTKYSN